MSLTSRQLAASNAILESITPSSMRGAPVAVEVGGGGSEINGTRPSPSTAALNSNGTSSANSDDQTSSPQPPPSSSSSQQKQVHAVVYYARNALLSDSEGGGLAPGARNAFAAMGEEDRRCWRTFITTSAAAFIGAVLMVIWLWEVSVADSIDADTGKVREFSFHYFVYCFIGGVLAGLAHTLVTPMDLVKCRMQVGEYHSVQEGLHRLFYVEGRGSLCRALPLLFRGWVPTTIAYCIQGSLKFSLYEVFKYLFLVRPHQQFILQQQADRLTRLSTTTMATTAKATTSTFMSGKPSATAWTSTNSATPFSTDLEDLDDGGYTALYQVIMFLIASFCAEVIADLGLAPWEAVKIRIQTTTTYPPFVRVVVPRMYAAEGLRAFYKGLVPLWCRQVPYTMMKFASFEKIVQALNYFLIDPNTDVSNGTRLCITLIAGVLAGFLCAVVSHPADTVLSKMNQRGRPDDDAAVHKDEFPATAQSPHGASSGASTTPNSSLLKGPSAAASEDREMMALGRDGSVPAKSPSAPGPAGSSPSYAYRQRARGVNSPAAEPMNNSASAGSLLRELGFTGLWRGLLPRMVMVGMLTALQWVVYDSFKVMVGLPTTGSNNHGAGVTAVGVTPEQ